ncbi:MAG: ATP cone domain-containing protein [Patescibacteria group bacterium]
MVCPFCSQETEVINSRPQKRTNGVWRRRHCYGCERIFTTVEKADLEASVRVMKRSGNLEPLSEAKLMISLYRALEHHKNAPEMALELSQAVVKSCLRFTTEPIVPSSAIAHQVIIVLKRFDAAAAIRYKSFQDPLQSKRDIRKALR